MEFPTRYDPTGESDLYRRWEEAGCFMPSAESRTGEYFSIVLPPPNATGTLHVGHAVMLAIEDMMVRYHRMKGDRTVWIPGTDHAAIATQHVVEKKLKKENVQGRRTRHDLGREAFVREVEQFVLQSQHRMIEQMRAMGASLDWSRLAYTLDEQRSHAVRTIFKQMYDAGILYRGHRIVHWCPRCKSTLADDEVEHTEEQTTLYTFRYDEQWPEDLAIATTRPETKFGDTAVAVHPDDPRAAAYAGKELTAAFTHDVTLRIRVIADPVIDRAFGTGALGVTPAHSYTDAELAERNGLPSRQVITEDGTMASDLGAYAGLPVREARERVIVDLRNRGLLIAEQPITHNLAVCYRCETPVEPLPKLQWFVAVAKPFRDGRSLKDLALDAVRSGTITIFPERFNREYFHWMENLRDWCISRQLWFGHRIPVWYRGEETHVGVDAPQGDGWEQDPDTLDTWFSAGTWTFSTLGWPQQTKDLEAFHPTNIIETAYDILFFWVARMIIMSEFALGEVPFKQVYLHGLVRDGKGWKMSKSLGNVIDPLDMTQKYGADAVRLALFIGTSPGQDTKLDEQKIAGYAKFVTKLWNIARYVALSCHSEEDGDEESHAPKNIGAGEISPFGRNDTALTIPDHWLLAKRAALVRDVTAAYEAHEYSKAAQAAYDFAWHEFADWYVEATKISNLSSEGGSASGGKSQISNSILTETLEIILKLLHPAMPFVTEELWSRMGEAGFSTSRREGELEGVGAMLITAPWPVVDAALPSASVQESDRDAFEYLRELVTAIRQLRNDAKIPPKTMVRIMWNTENERELEWLHDHHIQLIVSRLARVDGWNVSTPDDAPHATVRGTTVHVAPA